MASSGAAGSGDEPLPASPPAGTPFSGQKRLNIILDIDETFVQFVGKLDWEQLTEAERGKYTVTDSTKPGFFILRPHFTEFFEFLRDNCKTVNLWTLSERDYANDVKGIIESKISGLTIANAWGAEDEKLANDADYWQPKDLKYIWEELGLFKPGDTILVDDLPRNTLNKTNARNGIRLPPFDPLGEKREKSEQGYNRLRVVEQVMIKKPNGDIVPKMVHYNDMSEDRGLLNVISVLESVLPKINSGADPSVPVFPPPSSTGGRRKTRRKARKTRARKTKTRR